MTEGVWGFGLIGEEEQLAFEEKIDKMKGKV